MTQNEILRANIIKICKGEVGTVENPKGSNRTKYGEWFQFNGVAWCCMAVCWVFDSIGKRLKIMGNPKGFAHTKYIIDFADRHDLWTKDPKPGDIVLLDFKKDIYIDHIGIFEKFDGTTRNPHTFEGNTSADDKKSQDNGDGFYPKLRKEANVYGYINVDYFLNKP